MHRERSTHPVHFYAMPHHAIVCAPSCACSWSSCFSVNGFDQAEIQAIALELKESIKQFSETRKQVEKFLECVLDVDSAGREPQKQAAKNYHYDQPRNPELFRFEPIPLSFEPVEPGRCAPVLYSSAVRDMIDYSLRSCVERGVTVRRCKNCGRWFPQTGRVSAEYCLSLIHI